MGPRLRIALVAIALAGCPAEEPPPDSYSLLFQLDNSGDGATCMAGTTCGSFGMGCDAKVAVRILDLPDPENPSAQPPPLVPQKCLNLLGADSLCALGAASFVPLLLFSDLPREPGQIEVTIWQKVDEVEECPMVPYDVTGRPIPVAGPLQPAFGRRIFFDFGGQETVARIPLACTNANALVAAACEPAPTYDFEVHAEDINALLLGISPADAQFLQVLVGQPSPVDSADPDPEDFQIVSPAHTIELGLAGGGSPFWKEDDHEIEPEVDFVVEAGEDVCAIITDFGSQPAATCTKITAAQEAGTVPVSVDGFMVSTETWDMIQSAIGLNIFPSDGLILGRVVDTTMAPLANVVVTPDVPLPPVLWYINEDLTDITDGLGDDLTATSASGYFVAGGTNVPFRTTWDATRPTWRIVGTPTGGALNNKTLTVLLIQMTPDF